MNAGDGQHDRLRLRTGLDRLDLNTGGLLTGRLLVISGEEKSGRTSFLLQLCAIAASEDRDCYVIDPESRIHLSRLRDICGAWRADLSRIWIASPHTFREQTRFILKASEGLKEGDLIAVDNITYLYRVELTGDLTLDRPKFMELAFELAALKSAALRNSALSAAVFDVHDVPSIDHFTTRPVAEYLLKHFADLRVHLTNLSGDLKSMSYAFGPVSGELVVRTTSSGIELARHQPAVF
ncbi:MAG: hypothetical protein NZ988_02115 [Thaumarchaeota archaeon]|nr:hypothetical protein [Candidatus Calditenuaceae archaeon]MDW8186832.1 hypothetical protein [Nitrososphaerota archaeon]